MAVVTPGPSTTHKPAFLLVHAGFHLPATYAPFLDLVSKAGFVVRCPHLTTNGDAIPPKATLQDDVTTVQAVLTELAGDGYQIIVLAHSYGGLVASEAITADLYAEHEKAGVVRLIYLSAWMIQPDTTLVQTLDKHGFPTKIELDMNEHGMAFPKNPLEAFYHDVDEERAESLAKKLVTHNFNEISKTIHHAPWKDLPTFFVYCTEDLALGLELQKTMVRDAVESGAVEFHVRELESSHSPFWSMPAAVVAIVEEVWKLYVEGDAGH